MIQGAHLAQSLADSANQRPYSASLTSSGYEH